ncbi:MAG TPA: outer membrane beta-barrel protein, partial [Flavobacteriales bacterium]|nr:outer membrane beta-barrel protein [Flavobacteriales bacterium]
IKYYVYDNDTTNTEYLKKIESTYLVFPFYMKLRTNRINNFAAYGIGGGYYALDMANNKDLENNGSLSQLTVQTTKSDWGYSVGGGFDFFLQYFKFGIELKFNVGMKNVLKQDNTFFAAPLESIRTGSWVFSLTFEG